MQRKTIFICLMLGILATLPTNHVWAASSLSFDSIKIGSRFFAVDGDEGRFREDNYVTDDYSGGLEDLLITGTLGDSAIEISAHALYDGDYGLFIDLDRQDKYHFLLDSRLTRRYYDGSNEPWNPALYALGTEFADLEDGHMYADRINTDVEFGLALDNLPDITIGYTLWSRNGQESLLRGEDVAATGLNTLRSIPLYGQVDGVSHKIFLQLSDQVAEKHNVSVKQEFETYHDDQIIFSSRYSNGTLAHNRNYYDEPQFQESLTHINYDSFLTEKTYLAANYLFQDLVNWSRRDELRPPLTGTSLNSFINDETNNERKANILNMGFVNFDIKDLKIGLNARFEKSDTESEGQGYKGGTTLRKGESDQEEYQYAQTLSLTYSGLPRTAITYTLELEQRKLNWSELIDIGSYEMVTDFAATGGITTIDRETDVNHNDIVNTLQFSRRLNNKSKLTAKYKHVDKRRKYENLRDNLPASYPGYLGSSEQSIDQVTLGYTTSITQKWSGGLQYVGELNELGYAIQNGGDGTNLTRNAVSGSATGILTDKFTLTLMMMGDIQDMETPGVGISGNPTFYQGEKVFDYKVNRYIALLGGNYRLSDKTSTAFGFQHTEVDGTIRNSLDKLWISANHAYADDASLEGRLEFFNFNEKTLGLGGYNDFDDYHGAGAEVVYSRKF